MGNLDDAILTLRGYEKPNDTEGSPGGMIWREASAVLREITSLKAELAEANESRDQMLVKWNGSMDRVKAAELENEGLKNGSRDLMAANARLVEELLIERDECESARTAASAENQLRLEAERKREEDKLVNKLNEVRRLLDSRLSQVTALRLDRDDFLIRYRSIESQLAAGEATRERMALELEKAEARIAIMENALEKSDRLRAESMRNPVSLVDARLDYDKSRAATKEPTNDEG